MNSSFILDKFEWFPFLTQDIASLLVLAIFSFVFGMFIGRYKLITILINIYVSFAVVQVVPDKYLVDYLHELIIFLAGVAFLTLFSRQLFDVYISGSGSGFLWRIFVMSFLEVLFLLSIVLSIIPQKISSEFISPKFLGYLTSENARIFWMIAPLVFLIFIHKKLNR